MTKQELQQILNLLARVDIKGQEAVPVAQLLQKINNEIKLQDKSEPILPEEVKE